MMREIDWPLVVEAMKIVPPLVIAGIVAWIAYQQWVTAKKKLALDLFDKRFAANKRIIDLMAQRANERVEKADRMIGAYGTPLSDELDREIIEARYLFGEAVFQKMIATTDKLESLVRAKSKLHEINDVLLDDPVLDAHMAEISTAWRTVSRLKHEVADLVEPYMMLDHISVSRPRGVRPSPRKGLFAAADAEGTPSRRSKTTRTLTPTASSTCASP